MAQHQGPVGGSLPRPANEATAGDLRRSVANQPENVLARIRGQDLARGEATLQQGEAAIAGFNPEDFFGADALRAMFDQATTTNFLPQLRQLQGRAGRRGIRGPLAGALEGDLAAGFSRDLLAEVGRNRGQAAGFAFQRGQSLADIGGNRRAQGISALGTELELKLAREQATREEKAAKRRGVGALLGGIAGGVLGSFVPGLGTAVGAGIGSKIGGSF